MKMRWFLRYEESGKPKARLVIIGYHDPRVGSDVRTAQNQFSIERGDVKNAVLKGTFDNKTHGELAAEPVFQFVRCLESA